MQPVLVLGAGINGAALTRELVLNGLPVCLVDIADVASGTTAYSSRLIHGGLRYLEYGEFDLVRESLAERTRLLRLAPQFVRPLELFIPVSNRFGGLAASAARLLRRGRQPRAVARTAARGLWLIRSGLRLYDAYAKDPALPTHRVLRTGDPQAVPVDARTYRWQCAFHDAQVMFPERLVLAMVEDARQAAEETGARLEIFTYYRARLSGRHVQIVPRSGGEPVYEFAPSAIVNATGAWVDFTLRDLKIVSRNLIGGTKGSHFITSHARLREVLAGRGLYAEAADGRPFFVLPLARQVLVGTTDLPFDGDPAEAVASPEELDYLLSAVNHVLPQVRLSHADIDWHYSGVRPLPYSGGTIPAAITRRHWLEEHEGQPVPCYSIIGGKLTTGRSLAESACDTILQRLGRPRTHSTLDRPLPGGERHPPDAAAVAAEQLRLSAETGFHLDEIQTVWSLCGTRSATILPGLNPSVGPLDGTTLPLDFARWSTHHERVATLADLVERRLMLLYQPRLTAACLRQLSDLLVEAGKLSPSEAPAQLEATTARLQDRFGKCLDR